MNRLRSAVVIAWIRASASFLWSTLFPLQEAFVFFSFFSFFSKSFGSIFLGQQERGHRSVRFGDDQQLVACVCSVTTYEPEPVP